MRRYATFFLIAIMTAGVIVLLLSRSRTTHQAPPEVLEAKVALDAGAEAGAQDAGIDAAPVDAGQKPVERSMRVATLGWELAAPASALDGGAIEVSPEAQLDAIEARLARGGADPAGADVAVMPLPAFVSAYERLRALEPRAFVVVGFSHGREEVHASPGALLKAPPAADEVKIIGLSPTTSSEAAARAAGSESATILGLFALDLLGVAPARVRIVAPGSEPAKGATVSAITRGAADERKLALSTADASRLVPLVAVAPKAQLDANEAKLRDWAKTWLDALARAGKDVPGSARKLAGKEGLPLGTGVGGAPEAIALVERLGQIEPASLEAEAAMFAALEPLVSRTWQLARGGGLTALAAPDPLPIDARIVKAIAPAAAPKPAVDADAGVGTIPTGATPLVVYRAPVDATAETVAAQITFLASVFERSAFRIAAKGGDKAARAIAAKTEVAPARLAVDPKEPAGAFATVEILSLP